MLITPKQTHKYSAHQVDLELATMETIIFTVLINISPEMSIEIMLDFVLKIGWQTEHILRVHQVLC